MARKKKEDPANDIPLATDAKAFKKTKQVWPKVTVGSHLTVTEYEDGRTTLVWDDEALLKEVREAILSVEQVEKPVRKSTRKKKAENV